MTSPEQVQYLVGRLYAAEAVVEALCDPDEDAVLDECPLCHVGWGPRPPHQHRSGCLYERWWRFVAEETEVFPEWPMPTGGDEDDAAYGDAYEGDPFNEMDEGNGCFATGREGPGLCMDDRCRDGGACMYEGVAADEDTNGEDEDESCDDWPAWVNAFVADEDPS